MSLVGTRPPTVDEWEQYELHHRSRMSIKPGITGMWQASGRSDITDFEEVVKLDTEYIENQKYNENIKVISFSRRGGESSEYLECIKANVKQPLHYEGKIDYIIHLASNTHPKQYAEDPIGTIMTNIYGCDNLLKLAVEKKARFLLASSVEIYGQGTAIPMNEEYCG